jgi:DNA-directed RNA polymerase specialized sigma24 family protein
MSDASPSSEPAGGKFTLLLQRVDAGDVSPAEPILPIVYGELRKLAAFKMGYAELLRLNEALDALAAQDLRKAELVKLQYFVGLTVEESAAALGITDRTARRDRVFARTWLFNEIVRLRDAER